MRLLAMLGLFFCVTVSAHAYTYYTDAELLGPMTAEQRKSLTESQLQLTVLLLEMRLNQQLEQLRQEGCNNRKYGVGSKRAWETPPLHRP